MSATPIKFGDNRIRSGIDAVTYAAKVWETKITMPKKYTDTTRKLDQWRGIVTASQEELLVDQLDQADPKTWGDLINGKANEESARAVIQANATAFTNRLTRRAALLFNSPATYEHIVRQLPVDEVEGQFIDAACALGHRYRDMEAAVKYDAAATGTYMQAGLKLHALAAIPGSATTYDQNNHRPGNLATLCHINSLPELRRTVNYLTTLERHYSDAEKHAHDQAHLAKGYQANVGELLTRVVLGEFDGITVNVARTATELRARQDEVARIYEFTDKHTEMKGKGQRVMMTR